MRKIYYQFPMNNSTLFFDKKIDEVGGYSIKYEFINDFELVYRLSKKYDLVNTNLILSKNRVHKENLTNKKFLPMQYELLNFLNKTKLDTKSYNLKFLNFVERMKCSIRIFNRKFLMYEVSIIITAYNADKYITESINSIINQTFKKWILIVVDDGSSDSTFEILNSFKSSLKNQFILIKNEKNLGINISLNKALQKVETPYFARQDADDLSLPNRIEILIHSLKQNTKYNLLVQE